MGQGGARGKDPAAMKSNAHREARMLHGRSSSREAAARGFATAAGPIVIGVCNPSG